MLCHITCYVLLLWFVSHGLKDGSSTVYGDDSCLRKGILHLVWRSKGWSILMNGFVSDLPALPFTLDSTEGTLIAPLSMPVQQLGYLRCSHSGSTLAGRVSCHGGWECLVWSWSLPPQEGLLLGETSEALRPGTQTNSLREASKHLIRLYLG